jgi:DNA polymerase III subunit epsilon
MPMLRERKQSLAHNLDFDLPIITIEFLRCRLETHLAEKQTFCTMKTPQVVSWCRIPSKSGRGYKWPTLNELHMQLFQEKFAYCHNAGADGEACARCYFELRRGIIQ